MSMSLVLAVLVLLVSVEFVVGGAKAPFCRCFCWFLLCTGASHLSTLSSHPEFVCVYIYICLFVCMAKVSLKGFPPFVRALVRWTTAKAVLLSLCVSGTRACKLSEDLPIIC